MHGTIPDPSFEQDGTTTSTEKPMLEIRHVPSILGTIERARGEPLGGREVIRREGGRRSIKKNRPA